ncbi:chorismate mutase [Paenisporosarcina cavernae]|uniref:chorismate mutase n=1 Tax=Paenisporosarcina cavernae TaxID=2320858 RepID=A0A385YUZ8_9BACL|nr:chorismate mutase [Paenisporosarcina cavernae]AYC29392.1 chorismate mutase [Paenisporosarcina cavernae]
MIRGIRGATTITGDHLEELLIETEKLVLEMVRVNHVDPDEVASVIISTTTDICSGFPAKAVRSIEGWKYVPVMCTHEMVVSGSLPHCIRVLMHVNTSVSQEHIHHIYLNEAIGLRPDLSS